MIFHFCYSSSICFCISSLFNHSPLGSNPLGSAKILNQYIELNGSLPVLNNKGKKLASKNNLWIQIIDNNLNEIYEFNKPTGVTGASIVL